MKGTMHGIMKVMKPLSGEQVDMDNHWQICWGLATEPSVKIDYTFGPETWTITFNSSQQHQNKNQYTLIVNVPRREVHPVAPAPFSSVTPVIDLVSEGETGNVPRPTVPYKNGGQQMERTVPLGICTVCMASPIDAKLPHCPHAFCHECLLATMDAEERARASDESEDDEVKEGQCWAKCPECRVRFTGWEPLII